MSATSARSNRRVAASVPRPSTEQNDARPVIVHVLDQITIGGMETVAVNLIERTRSRYRHAVICLRGRGVLAQRLQASGVEVAWLDKRPGKDLGAYLRLRRLLREFDADIVHTYNIGAIDAAVWARLAGVRRIVHAEHGRDVSDPQGTNIKYRWLRRALAPAINAFVAVSHDLSRWLIADVGIGVDKVHLIHNGIDIQQYRPATDRALPLEAKFAPPDSVLIGTVGRLDGVKAFDGLIDAFALLCERLQDPRLRLVIVGDGPERTALAKRVQALGLGERVLLTGARDDVAAILPGLDIYVCSSVAEGIALTILEAMASALPVVATRVGGNPELVLPDETGALVPVSDANALAQALQALVENPEAARTQGRAGRVRAQQYFSIDTMTASYCRLYDQLLGAAAGPRALQAGS